MANARSAAAAPETTPGSPDARARLALSVEDVRAASAVVDEALDGLADALNRLDALTQAFAATWRGRGVDVRQTQAIVWAGYVHERLMQETGAFGRYLQNVHNTPSAWAMPVARWVPAAESLIADAASFKAKGDADERC
ncbi:MAG: hypothetical protein AB7O39_01000 [Flavobacteriaceae bacterium]